MRSFSHIAKLVKEKRQNHPKAYSQSELSHLLGYKNGQFISNVERSLCNIPLKMLGKLCEVLELDASELKEAILKDHEQTLNNYLKISELDNEVTPININLKEDRAVSTPQEYMANAGFKMSSNS